MHSLSVSADLVDTKTRGFLIAATKCAHHYAIYGALTLLCCRTDHFIPARTSSFIHINQHHLNYKNLGQAE